MAIPNNFIQDLLARADVVEIVGRHVQLKKAGANFSGLCPFHSEKSPSFTVSPSKQFYHCFGCGKNGNAIGFLMDFSGMGFVEAVQDLAQQYGMQVPDDDSTPQERAQAAEQRQKRATLSDVLETAGAAYRKQLRLSAKAVAYLKNRGVSGDVAKQFGLGYAPEGWRNLASVFPDYSDPLLVESGLVIVNEAEGQDGGEAQAKRYDRFRDRVMFPIRNVKGECIGFGGRVLGDEKPKYLNSPETPVFSKGRELYGLHEARNALRDAGYVLVTEGYMDVVALAQWGFPNAVATLGTACTAEHVHKLFRFTDAVVFSFDGDAAGRRAARKALDAALPYATDVRSVKFLFLPPEHDPDSYIRALGKDAFAQCVQEAVPLSRFVQDAAAEGCDLNTAEGRAHMASNAKPLWNLLPDGALKRQLLGEIADKVQLGSHELGELWGLGGAAQRNAGRTSGRPQSYQNNSYEFNAHKDSRPFSSIDLGAGSYTTPQTRMRGRPLPASRLDRLLQILLTDSQSWERLGHDDQNLLCALPEPYGDICRWVDAQHHDHGPQPWSALREALRDHPLEANCVATVERMPPMLESEPDEINRIIDKEREQALALKLQQLAKQAETDPEAFAQYRQLLQASKAKS